MNKKVKILIVVIVVVLVASLILGWLLKPAASNQPVNNTALSVEETKAEMRQWQNKITANGVIAAWEEVIISPETGGYRLMNMLAQVGDHVHRGQLLAQLADKTVKANLQKQIAAVDTAKANLVLAQGNLTRAEGIRKSGAISPQKIDEYQNARDTAAASLSSATAELANIKLTLTQTKIVADDDGIISAKTGVVGNVVAAGTELYRLIRQGRIEWRPELDATQLAQINVGQSVRIKLDNGETVSGKVRLVSPTISNTTGRALVYVNIPNDAAVRVGMFLSGDIDIGTKMVMTIPQTAVVLRDGRSYVYVLDKDNKATSKLVTVGNYQEDMAEIIRGIDANERIVASGGAFLSDGVAVKVTGVFHKPDNNNTNAEPNNSNNNNNSKDSSATPATDSLKNTPATSKTGETL